MLSPLGNIRSLRSALAGNQTTPTRLAQAAMDHADKNPSANTFLWRDPEWTRAEAARAEQMPASEGGAFGDGRPTLWGLPVAVKDCFDLAGAPTTAGTTFYRAINGVAGQDSWIVNRLREQGAVIIGKTHLHPIAYGITGENPDFGDCLQPGKENALTGGSSSGSAASILEGSSVAAIGTDTGGSIRVPAALCGIAGYRATLGRGNWRGGAHLAETFDTLGWLFADLEEGPLLAEFFTERGAGTKPPRVRAIGNFAWVGEGFLQDCEPNVLACYHQVVHDLQDMGLKATEINPEWWSEGREIFAPLQAWEAARVHAGNFGELEPLIAKRLEWGSRIRPDEVASLRQRHAEFRQRMDELFDAHQIVLLPAAPVAKLTAGADHTETRPRLLRYTAPFSLAGSPAVTVPCAAGGVQISAARDEDEALLQVVAVLGARRKAAASGGAQG